MDPPWQPRGHHSDRLTELVGRLLALGLAIGSALSVDRQLDLRDREICVASLAFGSAGVREIEPGLDERDLLIAMNEWPASGSTAANGGSFAPRGFSRPGHDPVTLEVAIEDLGLRHLGDALQAGRRLGCPQVAHLPV